MSVEHLFYIPMVLILGSVLGFTWGRAAALKEFDARTRIAEKREQERAERKKAQS